VTRIFATGAGGIFGVPEFAAVLSGVVKRCGIDARFGHNLVELKPSKREAVFEVTTPDGTRRERIGYDLLHVVPPQSPPEFVKQGPFADPDNPLGWFLVDKNTMAHPGRPEVFALGDACSAPNSKTGAAIRKQAPVVVSNLLAAIAGRGPVAEYDGYAACPFTTARGKVVMAEFDYTGRPHKTVPLVDTIRERRDMWMLKRYGLPLWYWHIMLKGRDKLPASPRPRLVQSEALGPDPGWSWESLSTVRTHPVTSH
jgi:sulfide:quinone oxidoreductase